MPQSQRPAGFALFAQLIVGVYNYSILIVFFYSLLLRFTDDKFDPEQAATIGECVPVRITAVMAITGIIG